MNNELTPNKATQHYSTRHTDYPQEILPIPELKVVIFTSKTLLLFGKVKDTKRFVRNYNKING
jgi:hypothetical protein